MASAEKTPADIKWNTRQRFQCIELLAFYTGVVTRSDIARTFGISDAAATKDLKLYGQLAPDNLVYKHSVFGFVPAAGFAAIFTDLSPAAVLPLIADNLPSPGGPAEHSLVYGIAVESLPLPSRLPDKQVLAQIIQAIKNHKKLQASYRSLSDRDGQQNRIIEPHSLINNGLRWHVRAYNEQTFDFRDFVLSRFVAARVLDDEAESSQQYDDDWMETVTLKLTPHTGMSKQKQLNLLIDYGVSDTFIEVEVRRALLGYVLQRLAVDTTADHSLNPKAYQLILVNRDEIEPYAGWAFL
jgi:hypothetical protein